MKEFNLQDALDGAKVVTRDGRDVKIAGHNAVADDNNELIGWVETICACWDERGRYVGSEMHERDLFMAPTERKEWVVRVQDCHKSIHIYGPFQTYPKHYEDDTNATIHEITILE